MDHPHLLDLSRVLGDAGLVPFRFDFPYREQGRKFPDKMPVLVESFRESADRIRKREKPGFLILAGHSMGARAAVALAAEAYPCRGVILFSYPLHPPGHPEKLRLDNMDLPVPVLSLSGTRDPFCTPALMDKAVKALGRRPAGQRWTHHWLEGADHGLKVAKNTGLTRQDALAEAGEAIRSWLEE
ncbi:MAG: dienelactone hydrolase [Fibrobacteres bacterium]|nr:dienelactone hydrolase [Fibrobacterota bacterium]